MKILIRGAGDIATGIALRLYRAGMQVVMTDLPAPTAIRRTVCFSQAIILGEMTVEDVTARRAETPDQAEALLAQGVAPHGLHHGVAVLSRREARTDAHDNRRIVHFRAQVALGQNRVDHSRGFKLIEHLGLRVHHHGDIPRLGNLERLSRRLRQAGANALDLDLAQANGLAKTDCATDARGNRDIGHDDRHAGAHQTGSDTRGDIAGAANINEHSRGTSLCYGLSRAKAVRPLL